MPTASEVALSALKSQLDGGRMFWFSGPVPANENVALDMVTLHTQLVEMTESGDGTTGLTFADPDGIAMTKNDSEVWSGLIEFDGAQATETTLPATFYRFCGPGDDGRGVATQPRLQGTIGAPGSDIPLTNAELEANTLNTQGMSYFAVIETPMSAS
jgi:hypothetical protein